MKPENGDGDVEGNAQGGRETSEERDRGRTAQLPKPAREQRGEPTARTATVKNGDGNVNEEAGVRKETVECSDERDHGRNSTTLPTPA